MRGRCGKSEDIADDEGEEARLSEYLHFVT